MNSAQGRTIRGGIEDPLGMLLDPARIVARDAWCSEVGTPAAHSSCHTAPDPAGLSQPGHLWAVPQPTENTVSVKMAQYLVGQGLQVDSFVSARGSGSGEPDFRLRGPETIYGEAKWESKFYKEGYPQAISYADIADAGGVFLLGYPEELRARISKGWFDQQPQPPEVALGGVEYLGLFKLKGRKAEPFSGPLEGIPEWLRTNMERRPPPPSGKAFVRLLQGAVTGINEQIPFESPPEDLFHHVAATLPDSSGEITNDPRVSAYLMINQLVFYRFLAPRGYVALRPEAIKSPADLRQYFNQVLKDDYRAVFHFDVTSDLPQSSALHIQNIIRFIDDIQPEGFTRDLLGSIFHDLIPQEIRKPVAAFYTNPYAARLLAKLAIDLTGDRVADFACGSGTLLMAAYDRKAELLGHAMDETAHQRFIEHDLTGVDIMAFAAHLAVVQLALRNPGLYTDKVRIAINDSVGFESTGLKPQTKIRPLQEIRARGQLTLKDFQDGAPPVRRRTVRRGAVSSDGAGEGFRLGYMDVVLMNPPFTRKQKISDKHRAILTGAFRDDYAEYASGEQNITGYFVLLADRFLKPGGRIAMVLPQTILQQSSSAGVRQLLVEKYDLEYIVQSGGRLAFSESAAFREILLVARKREQTGPHRPCLIVRLGVVPTEGNMDTLGVLLRETHAQGSAGKASRELAKSFDTDLSAVPQARFNETANWLHLIPEAGLESFDLSGIEALAPLERVVTRVVQGFRFNAMEEQTRPKNTLLSHPRAARVRMEWEIVREDAASVTARSRANGVEVEVPRGALQPSTRSPAAMSTIEITQNWDYIVVSRFPGDTGFWDEPDPNVILQARVPHLETRKAHLIVPGRNNVNLGSENTHLLAFVATKPIATPWTFWSIQTRSLEDAKFLSLWMNSTLHLAQLLLNRVEVGGTWGGWPKEILDTLLVLDPSKLSDESRTDLNKVYREWATKPFPSLIEQLQTQFSGRMAIDEAVIRAIRHGSRRWDLPGLYATLASKLGALRKIMG
jgi:hypothetical protein